MSYAHVYKLLTAADAKAARASGFTDTALDRGDGYVHLSTVDQVGETARLHYAGEAEAELFMFPVSALAPLKWEVSRGGQLFPHLYGRLELAAAARDWQLALSDDGTPVMPGGLLR